MSVLARPMRRFRQDSASVNKCRNLSMSLVCRRADSVVPRDGNGGANSANSFPTGFADREHALRLSVSGVGRVGRLFMAGEEVLLVT